MEHSERPSKRRKVLPSQSPDDHLSELIISDHKFLDFGAEGDVFTATWSGRHVAVKRLRTRDIDRCAEVKHMQKLKHKNLVQLLGIGIWESCISIVMEYCGRGSLGRVLKSEEDIGWDLWKKWIMEIVDGLSYLNEQNIIHRDLKPDNILITEDSEVRISDFGMARSKLSSNSATMSNVGTIRYMAPELLRSDKYSKKIDVWSFGVIVWEMLCRTAPYGCRDATVVYNVGNNLIRLKIPPAVPSQISILVRSCWHTDASQRPTISDIRGSISTIFTEIHFGSEEWTKCIKSCRQAISDSTYMDISVEENPDVQDEKGMTALHRAAIDDSNTVARLLNNFGANATIRSKDGMAAIHVACVHDNVTAVQHFLDFGVGVDVMSGKGRTPLQIAAMYDSTNVIQLLLAIGANHTFIDKQHMAAIHWASQENCLATVRLLVEHGVDVNLRDATGETPFYWAVLGNASDVACFLLERGADMGCGDTGRSPLFFAAEFGSADITKWLLEHGADIRFKGNEHGESPAHMAISSKNMDILRMLKEYGDGFDIADDYGWLPMHDAAVVNAADATIFLLESGANPKLKDKNGDTALHAACSYDSVEVVRVLLEHDVELNIPNGEGFWPLEIATYANSKKVVAFLRANGVNSETRIQADTSLQKVDKKIDVILLGDANFEKIDNVLNFLSAHPQPLTTLVFVLTRKDYLSTKGFTPFLVFISESSNPCPAERISM